MKVRIDYAKYNRNTKICVMMGYYDENGKYYETDIEEITRGNLINGADKKISAVHDITFRVSPKCSITVFARNVHLIEEYRRLNDNEQVKGMLDALSKYHNPEDGCFWGTYDLPTSI